MRKAFTLLAILFTLALCSCGDGLAFKDTPTIQYARDNAELLSRCADEISSDHLSNGWCSVLIYPEDGKLFTCENSVRGETTKTEIQSIALSELFGTKKIKKIRIWNLGGSPKYIEFLVDSMGMGSTSLSEIVYIPSDSIEDCDYYSDQMRFHDFREGYMGEIDGSDDYLYYVRVFSCFFYVEYGD